MEEQDLHRTIELKIGNKLFTTTPDILASGSGFFAAMFSGRWRKINMNMPLSVDADESLFVHILRFLKHGMYPFLYSSKHGIDYTTYMALQGEAEHF